MLLDLLWLALGTGLLALCGDRMVDAAVAIAERARLSPAVIGLTIVAAGTSAPELVVSVAAALRGSPGIAIGNVVGSNIANVGLILGSCAAIAAVPVTRALLRFEYPFLLLCSWIALLLCRDGRLDRLEGAFFVVSIVAFTAYSVGAARQQSALSAAAAVGEPAAAAHHAADARRPAWALLLALLASLGGLLLGGELLVTGAVGLAQAMGISERVVGLTVVAFGTSVPELAVSLAAALKKQQELAVANIVGSNIFNLLMILGLAALVRPLPVDARILDSDLWVMLAFTVALFPLTRSGLLSRTGGLGLVSGYLGYVAWLSLA